MSSIIEEFIEWNRKNLQSERSRIEYARDLSIFEAWLEDKSLLTATKYDIELYKRTSKVSNRTTNRKLSVIRSFYTFLVDSGKLSENPSDKVRGVKVERRHVPRLVNLTSLNILFDHKLFPDRSYNLILSQTIFRTFYYTGIRLSELIGIDIGDIDFKERKVTVTGKGNLTRIIKFSKSLLNWLEQYSSCRGIKSESAFFISNEGERLTKSKIWYFFTKLKRRTGIRINPHALRHTFASHALSRGMDLAQVQEVLGHAEVSTTSIYIDVAKSTEDSYDKAFP